MKPERVQIFEQLGNGAKTCAQKIWELLDWVERAATTLKGLFEPSSDDK